MLGIPSDAFVVGTVGRLNAQKAPFDFVRLAALMNQSHPGIHFVWIGDGDLLEPARNLARHLGVETLIHFMGARSDVIPLLRGMDCFLLTSHWEAFPIVILEAMASQLPVVASNLPGIAEVVADGCSGYLCPIGDLEAMRAALEKIIGDQDHAARLGQNGRNRIIQSFTRERMIQELENVYSQVANDV
jgi:glycosyltransferase involved in cell wall biosynthesis